MSDEKIENLYLIKKKKTKKKKNNDIRTNRKSKIKNVLPNKKFLNAFGT